LAVPAPFRMVGTSQSAGTASRDGSQSGGAPAGIRRRTKLLFSAAFGTKASAVEPHGAASLCRSPGVAPILNARKSLLVHEMIEPRFTETDGPEQDQVWYTALNGKQQGPFSGPQIVGQLRNKPIDPGFLVWKPGMKEWSPILQSELHSSLYTATTPPPLAAQEVANGWIWAITLSPIWLAVIAEIMVPAFFRGQYGAAWEIPYATTPAANQVLYSWCSSAAF
jgi:hypothetical protein